MYTYKGETHSLGDWSRLLGIKYVNLYQRINQLGWSLEKAFSESIDKNRKRKAWKCKAKLTKTQISAATVNKFNKISYGIRPLAKAA